MEVKGALHSRRVQGVNDRVPVRKRACTAILRPYFNEGRPKVAQVEDMMETHRGFVRLLDEW